MRSGRFCPIDGSRNSRILICLILKTFTPTQPNPTQPNPTQPNPTQPNPTQPNPTQPNPTQPNPTQSIDWIASSHLPGYRAWKNLSKTSNKRMDATLHRRTEIKSGGCHQWYRKRQAAMARLFWTIWAHHLPSLADDLEAFKIPQNGFA